MIIGHPISSQLQSSTRSYLARGGVKTLVTKDVFEHHGEALTNQKNTVPLPSSLTCKGAYPQKREWLLPETGSCFVTLIYFGLETIAGNFAVNILGQKREICLSLTQVNACIIS